MPSLTSTLLPLLFAFPTSSLPLVSRAQTCYSGLYILVARGSNEAVGEGKTSAVAKLIESRVPNSFSVAINYPAVIISDTSDYPASVTDGVDDTKAKIEAYVAACGAASRIALLGYSQGGNVVTDTLAGGIDKPDPIDVKYKPYITAAAVFGDPSFSPGQPYSAGSATTDGIFSRRFNILSNMLLKTYGSVLRSYCSKGDFFCADGGSLDIHYAEVQDWMNAAADFVVSKANARGAA